MFLFLIWVRIQILFVNFNLISSCSLHGSRTSLGHESFLLMVEDSKALPPGLKVISVRRGVQPHELHCPEHLIRWVIRKRLQETCSWFFVLNDYIYNITQRPMVIKRYRDHIVTNMLHVSMQEQWSSNVVDWASVFIEVLISVQEQDGVDSVDYSREVSQTSENQTNEELNSATAMPETNSDERKKDRDHDLAAKLATAHHQDWISLKTWPKEKKPLETKRPMMIITFRGGCRNIFRWGHMPYVYFSVGGIS